MNWVEGEREKRTGELSEMGPSIFQIELTVAPSRVGLWARGCSGVPRHPLAVPPRTKFTNVTCQSSQGWQARQTAGQSHRPQNRNAAHKARTRGNKITLRLLHGVKTVSVLRTLGIRQERSDDRRNLADWGL